MASSAISLISQSQTSYQSTAAQARQDFLKLAQSLQTGNLTGAQQAYVSLQQLLGTQSSGDQAVAGASASSPQNAVSKDFAALGQALSSGDLSGAQNAFSALQSDLKGAAQSGASAAGGAARAHHGHHHHASAATDSDSSTASTTSTSTSSSASSDSSLTSGESSAAGPNQNGNYSFLA